MLLAAHAIIINSSNWPPSYHYQSPSNRIITKYCHKVINSVGQQKGLCVAPTLGAAYNRGCLFLSIG